MSSMSLPSCLTASCTKLSSLETEAVTVLWSMLPRTGKQSLRDAAEIQQDEQDLAVALHVLEWSTWARTTHVPH